MKNKIYYKVIIFALAIIQPLFLLSGCAQSNGINDISNKKITIIASLFPQYDFARQIAKDKADVSLLLPPGSESHTFEPTAKDMLNISNSDIFLYTGQYMEPWANKVVSSVDNDKTLIKDVSTNLVLLSGKDNDECECCDEESCSCHDSHENCHHKHHHEYDPHVWLNPQLAAVMIDNVLNAICSKDPKNKDFYTQNANDYKEKILNLDKEIENFVNTCSSKKVIFASRFAHRYFIERYGLEYMAAFDGCSTESEPSVKRMSEIIDTIKKEKISHIYYEELNVPKVAASIAEQTGVKAMKFSSIHNVSKEQLENNVSYLDLMTENFENLKQGLN